MKIFIILLILAVTLLAGPAIAVDMVEIEAIRMEVGPEAIIVPVPHYNCSHVYIVKMADGSIWAYYSSGNHRIPKSSIVTKALLFHGEKNLTIPSTRPQRTVGD